MPKQLIRDRMLTQRGQCDQGLCQNLGREIQERFLRLDVFASAQCLALYSPIRNEVDTTLVAKAALNAGKTVVYPRVEGEHLTFLQTADPDHLEPGAFNVLEPVHGAILDPVEIDLCVVPGVAFDRRGHRLGYGRGFYDRFLSSCREQMPRIGFAYDFQVVDCLPTGEYDQSLSMIVTEMCTLNFCR